MRILKKSTVEKAFIKRGWYKIKGDKDYLVSPDLNAGSRVFAEIKDNGYMTLSDARWIKRGNVHIVSYWGPFKNKKYLEKSLDDIETVYTTLCGSVFLKNPSPHQCPMCNFDGRFLDGDDVYQGYKGWPVCPNCRTT